MLAQEWVRQQGRQGRLPFTPDGVGSHWSRHVQVDVVGIDWQSHTLLLGECKWTGEPIDRQIVRELIEEKVTKVLHDLADINTSWQVHFGFFCPRRFYRWRAQ